MELANGHRATRELSYYERIFLHSVFHAFYLLIRHSFSPDREISGVIQLSPPLTMPPFFFIRACCS